MPLIEGFVITKVCVSAYISLFEEIACIWNIVIYLFIYFVELRQLYGIG